jgi:hypothetical protein
MTPQEELDFLDNLYVARNPAETHRNVANRIAELQLTIIPQETKYNEQLSEKEGFFYDKPE